MAGNELAHPAGHEAAHPGGHEEEHGPVIAPDQLKPPPFQKLTRLAAFVVIILLPIMAFIGNHRGNVEKIFLVGIAGFMLLMLIVDFFLKRAGLKNT